MAKIVITSGPTRQYLDPVRYLTNSSSGRMGSSLAEAAIELGHQVTIVSGPVQVVYPATCDVIRIITTEEMLAATTEAFAQADGLIGAAAPCDYMPRQMSPNKLSKTGQNVQLELIETPDIVATLGAAKRVDQWVVGFALETEDQRFRAIVKMQHKCCDMIVSNGPAAIDSTTNEVEVMGRDGTVLAALSGDKRIVAQGILNLIQLHLIKRSRTTKLL